MVLKPSEIAPISGVIFAEIVDEAGAPPGVFNLINGDGPSVGQVMAGHADVDMVSFTGSTRAGVIVAKTAADTVKRVARSWGASRPTSSCRTPISRRRCAGRLGCFSNSGQSCDAPTRMLVPIVGTGPRWRSPSGGRSLKVGDPSAGDDLGPVVSRVQFNKIQRLIAGIEKGLCWSTGGLGHPDGLNRGY